MVHGKITKTRYAELGVTRIDRSTWRFVAMDGEAPVGPFYRTKTEALADLERYAAFYGCPDAIVAIETRAQCEHGNEKGYCLTEDCPFNAEAPDCGVCGGIHTKAFYNSGLDCRAAYPRK